MTPAQILKRALAAQLDAQPTINKRGILLDIGNAAGLKLGYVVRAAEGLTVSASDHIRLCAALRIDPATGEYTTERAEPGDFDFALLSVAVRMTRLIKGHTGSLRKTATAIGVVHSTLLKIIRGQPVSIVSVLAACRYVGVSPFHYLKQGQRFTENKALTTLSERAELDSAA